MADVQQTYRFKFEFDRKDVKKQLNNISLDVKDIVAQIGDASDKVTIFKGLVSYLSDVDKALVTFKTKHKDDFTSLFGNPDTEILNVLTTIFNTTQQSAQAFVTLKDKISAAESGKADLQSLRGIAEEVNALFVAIGQVPRIDIDKMFSGKGSKAKGTDFAGRIKLLNETLAEFGITYSGFQARLSGGFNFGSGAGVGDGFISEIQALIDHIDKKNQELIAAKERLDKTLEDFDNAKKNGVSDDYQIELTEESVRNLTLEYDNLQAELENADAASAGFYVTLTRLIEVSLKLKRAFKDVAANSALKDTFMNISAGSGSGDDTLYSRLSRYAHSKDPMNKDVQRILDRDDMQHNIDSNNYLIADLKTSNDINAVIQKRIELQDRLIAKLEQHSELYDKMMFTEDVDEADLLDEQLYSIEKEVATLTGYTNKIDDISVLMRQLGEEGERTDAVLQRLYETLGMETPDAFETRLKGLLAESRAAVDSLREAANPAAGGNTAPTGSSGGGSGSGSGDGTGGVITANVDFTNLENTIKAEAAALSDKLDSSTFKVELMKDHTKDIQSSITEILNMVQQIANHYHVDKNKTDVDNMKKNLLQLLDVVNKHNAGRDLNDFPQSQELGVSLMSDGSFSVNYGDESSVAWRHMAESMLANLNKTVVGDIHSHPIHEFLASGKKKYVSDVFSGSEGDVGAFRMSKALGAQMGGMITGNVLRVLDISALSQDMMSRLKTELAKVEQRYADSGLHSKYIEMDNGGLYLKGQSNLEDMHHATALIETMLHEALVNVGLSHEDIDNNVYRKYNLTDDAQLTDLATRLVQLVSSAEKAAPPLQRLTEIITKFGGDVSSPHAATLLEAYDKGELKASEVFNELMTSPHRKVSESAIQSLLDINNANQTSPIETLLTNISSILSNINTLVGRIDASVQPNTEQKINSAIGDLIDLRSGIENDGLSRGVESIYNGTDATRYRYDDVESRAISAVDQLLTSLQLINDPDVSFGKEHSLEAIGTIIDEFKRAFTYVRDLGKQRDLLTGGRTLGDYIDPNNGDILGSVHPGHEGTYENLHRVLTEQNGVLDRVIQHLTSMRDDAFAKQEETPNGQLQTTLDHLSIAINDLNSEISNLRTELSQPKNAVDSLTKSDISTAIKEGMFAKEFASGYKKMELNDFVDYDDRVDMWVSNITGELFDTFDDAIKEFDNYFSEFYMSTDPNNRFFGTKEEAFDRIAQQQLPDDDNFATVIVDAINDQTGKIVQAIKVILPDRISSNATSSGSLINENQISDAFEAVAMRAMSWSDDNHSTPRTFFNEILRQDGQSRVHIDDALSNALKTLGMMTNDGVPKFTVAKDGMRNLGVAIAKDFVIPTRPSGLDQAQKLMPLLNQAVELGAAIPRIISYLSDDDRVFELQTRMKGQNIAHNTDFMKATNQQIDRLLHTFEVMSKVGLYPDFIGDNVLFDKNHGFSLVDIESENITWGQNLETAEGIGESFLKYVRREFPDISDDFANRFRERMALPAEQRLVNENTVSKSGTGTQGSAIDVSNDIANLETLLNKVRTVAGEIRNLANEVSTMIQSVTSPFDQNQNVNDTFVADPAEISRIQSIYDAESESAKQAIDEFAVFYKEYSDLKNIMHQAFPVNDEENPTESEKNKVLNAFEQLKQKKEELAKSDLGTDQDIKEIRQLKAEMIGLQAVIQSVWHWDSNKKDYQKRFNLSDQDVDFFYDVITGDPINDIDRELSREYVDKELHVAGIASHYFSDALIGKDYGMDDFLIAHAMSLSGISEQSGVAEELAPLEKMQSQLLAVKETVDAKTQAFEREKLVVGTVVDAEIASLQSLENQLAEILVKINLIDDGFNRINANNLSRQGLDLSVGQSVDNVGIDSNYILTNVTGVIDNIRDCLQRLTEVLGGNMASFGQTLGSSDSNGEINIVDEIDKLGVLKTVLAEVKDAITSKTKAFIDEGNVVGQVVGKEVSALMKLSDIVDGIAPKVNSLVEGLKNLNDNGVDVKQPDTSNAGDTKGGTSDGRSKDNFAKSLRDQKTSFDEYRKSLQDVDYLSEELRAELDRLAISLQQVGDKSGLDAFKKDLESVKREIDIKKRSHEATGLGTIHSEEKKLTNTFNALTFKQREEFESYYNVAIEQLQRYETQVKAGKKVELQAIRETTAALLQKLEAQKQGNKDAEKTQKKNAKFGDTAMINATAKYNQLSQTANGSFFADSKKVQAAFKEYDNAYQRLKNMQSDLNKKDNITKSDEAEFKAATTSCNDYAKALKQLIDNSMKLHGEKANQDAYMLGADFVDDVDGRKKVLSDFAKELYGVSLSSESFKKNYNEAVFEVANSDGTFTKMTARFTDARNEIVAMAGDTKKAVGLIGELWNQFKGKLKSIFTYLTASFSLHEVWSVIKQGVNHVREIDSALTELKKVTDETDASYARFLEDMSKTGAVIGATVKDLTTMAAEWARLGSIYKISPFI